MNLYEVEYDNGVRIKLYSHSQEGADTLARGLAVIQGGNWIPIYVRCVHPAPPDVESVNALVDMVMVPE